MKKARIKQNLERRPALFLRLLKIKRFGHWSRHWIVDRKTDVTIEGYPRSGNSFARSAFAAAQGKRLRIATHVHSSAQVVRSVQLGKPTMVLLRPPRDACLSLVALTYEIDDTDLSKETLGKAKAALLHNLRAYCDFYRRVAEVKNGVIVAEFERVTRDFGEVIRRMNHRYGTQFGIYTNSEAADAKVFEHGGFHLSPNEKRNAIKAFLAECLESPDVKALADQAHGVYEHILAIEREQGERYGTPAFA